MLSTLCVCVYIHTHTHRSLTSILKFVVRRNKILTPFLEMVKQKLHTARNQTFKAHRNAGLRKKKKERFIATKGMDPKYLRNLRFSKKHNKKVAKKEVK